jgi:hypothetical protein
MPAGAVFAQERRGLLIRPVIRDRRDRIERGQVLVERTRRVAIGDREAALELRHEDHAHRSVRQRDEILALHEFAGNPHRIRRDLDKLVARGTVRSRKIKRGLDGSLLLRRRGLLWRRRSTSLAREDTARDGVHLLAHVGDGSLGALPDIGPRHRALQRESKLRVEHFGARPELGLRGRHKRGVDPGLMLVDSGIVDLDGVLDGLAQGCRRLGKVRRDKLVDDALQALVLLRIGLRVRRRNACWHQLFARLTQESRQRRHALRGVSEALVDGRKLAGHQRIDRTTGDVLVDQWVPRPVLQGFRRPDLAAQGIRKQGRIDLIGARQLAAIDLVDIRQYRLRKGQSLAAAIRAHVIKLRIKPVVTRLRGRDRRQAHERVQPAPGNAGEGLVSSARARAEHFAGNDGHEHGGTERDNGPATCQLHGGIAPKGRKDAIPDGTSYVPRARWKNTCG